MSEFEAQINWENRIDGIDIPQTFHDPFGRKWLVSPRIRNTWRTVTHLNEEGQVDACMPVTENFIRDQIKKAKEAGQHHG